MRNSKPSIYTLEERDQLARECYELMQENKTTVTDFANERNITRKCLYNWIQVRYKKANDKKSGFVRIEAAADPVSVSYYGATIKTTEANLANVLKAIRVASAT